MVDSTHCSQCSALLTEIDFYGERMVGCIDCNRWTRDGWLYIHLAEEDLAALRADRGPKTIAEFLELQTGWTMLLDDGWYASYNEEKPLGPFATEAEAARAGLRAWRKETAPGGSSWGRLQDQDCGLPWSPLFVQESSGHPAERRLAPKWPGGCSAKNTHRIKVKLTLVRLRSLRLGMAGHAHDLPFRVELWDDKDSHIEEVIALASDYATARSAYEEAVKQTRQAHHVAAEDEGHSKEPMTCNANAASSYSLRLSAMGITSLAASNAIAGRATRALGWRYSGSPRRSANTSPSTTRRGRRCTI